MPHDPLNTLATSLTLSSYSRARNALINIDLSPSAFSNLQLRHHFLLDSSNTETIKVYSDVLYTHDTGGSTLLIGGFSVSCRPVTANASLPLTG